LAIARRDVHFTLVDRNARKIRFVTQAARTLELENVTAWCGDVRQLPGEAAFDTIVSRAVSDPRGVWSLARERLAPFGRMVVLHQGQGVRSADVDPQTPAPPGEAVAMTRHEVRIPGLAKSHVLVTMRRQPR
jgi:16S rRNA (guanine527-N7)-methyltransferase